MHRKHGIDRGSEVTEENGAWGGYPSGSGVPPPLEKLQRTSKFQHNRACQVLVYVLFDRRHWVSLTHSQLYRPYSGRRRLFIIAFAFNSLKIRLRLIGVTFRAALTQKFFPTQTEV